MPRKRKLAEVGSQTITDAFKRARVSTSSSLVSFADFLADTEQRRLRAGSDETLAKRIRPKGGDGTHGAVPSSRRIHSVVYWMSRDQRVHDNWALIYAASLAARSEQRRLDVVFCLVPSFLGATLRAYHFMLEGLRIVEEQIRQLHGNVRFSLLQCEKGSSITSELLSYVDRIEADVIITDFGSLRISRNWLKSLTDEAPDSVHVCQVDAHNIVPVWVASEKQEYAARTIRRKIESKLDRYLCEFPSLKDPQFSALFPDLQSNDSDSEIKSNDDDGSDPVDWDAVYSWLTVDESVGPVTDVVPGLHAANARLHRFLYNGHIFANYALLRNDPCHCHATSELSPWLHFGQISAQRIALETKAMMRHRGRMATEKHRNSEKSFLEELIVRRELSENFCFYNNDGYDKIEGASEWARITLELHSKDKREHVYSFDQLDKAQTHDDLWNAAQTQMVRQGRMPGFLRMYWAKKILEWSDSPQIALDTSIELNDRYELDGRDANGYTGCMWSVCGIHDQGWAERPIFGKIRYMNYRGCQRKFNVAAYVAMVRDQCGSLDCSDSSDASGSNSSNSK